MQLPLHEIARHLELIVTPDDPIGDDDRRDAEDAEDQHGDVSNYQCREFLLASGDERDLAIMFLQGYFVGKSGKTTYDRDHLARATDRFLEMCLDTPDEKVIVVMEKALKADAG